jgi:hypothetical protein
MTNTEEAAAWAVIPGIAQTETRLREMEARAAALGHVDGPDAARERVFADALEAMHGGASFPADLGKRAARAYTKALEDESEALGVRTVVRGLKAHVDALKLANVQTALEELGERFGALLTDVRAAVADLDGARSGEEAVLKSDAASAAWRRLAAMVGRLSDIRQAQFNLLRLDAGDGSAVVRLRRKGLFEIRGVDVDDVPADRLPALTQGAYDVPYLIFLAGQPDAWLPTSYDELRSEDATPDWGVPDGFDSFNAEVREYPPSPAPRAAETYPHSTSPQIGTTVHAAPRPKASATVADPKPADVAWRY